MNKRSLFDRSYDEVNHIARWYADHRGRSEKPPTLLLIGGWAVYKHNPYTFSRDIDLVVTSNARQSLVHWLRNERGFVKERDAMGEQSVMLRCPQGTIELDHVPTTAKNQFHGRKETLPFGMAREHSIVVDFEEGFLPIPERGPLFLLKLKALHDRLFDIKTGKGNIEWLKLKVIKDRADILALVHMERGAEGIDLGLVGKELERLAFLMTPLETVSSDAAACRLYGVTTGVAEQMMGTFLSLVRP
jgi:hypothetical protein